MSGRQNVLSKDWKAGYRPQGRMVSMSIEVLILMLHKLCIKIYSENERPEGRESGRLDRRSLVPGSGFGPDVVSVQNSNIFRKMVGILNTVQESSSKLYLRASI